MLEANLANEWIEYVQARHAREYEVSTDEIEQRNITEEFEQIVKRADEEPELVQSIIDAVQGGNGIETMIDVVRYYGMNPEKTVRGDKENRTRAEYLQQEITFHNRLPQTVQDELRKFIVGLAAQESRFNAGLPKNAKTAEGIMQLTDDVRVEHLFTKDVQSTNPDKNIRQREDAATKVKLASLKLPFTQEVDIAGKHFSNIYTRVRYWMKHEMTDDESVIDRPDTYIQLRSLFPEGAAGDHLWQKYFLTPCMVTAYNTGSRRVGACLHEFITAHTQEELKEITGVNPGYDLFNLFTHFAQESDRSNITRGFDTDAQAYFVSIAGVSEGLAGR